MDNSVGILGKLPMHGDFVQRNLPGPVINLWHEWLQDFVGSTQEQLADAWLDIYLTSPIWRFYLSPGVIDSRPWAGILLPSVDRVGRYFPLLLTRPLPADTLATVFIEQQHDWFRALEDAALAALDGQMNVDGLLSRVAELPMPAPELAAWQLKVPLRQGLVVEQHEEAKGVSGSPQPRLLQALINQSFPSYSLWSTEGSVRVEPCCVISGGLPPLGQAPALLDGLWEHWQWSAPFAVSERNLKAE